VVNGIVRQESRLIHTSCFGDVHGPRASDQWTLTREEHFYQGRFSSTVLRYHQGSPWTYDSLMYDANGRLSSMISFRNGTESSRFSYTYSTRSVKVTMRYANTEYVMQEFAYDLQGLLESETLYTANGLPRSRKHHVYNRTELERLLINTNDSTITYVFHEGDPSTKASIRYYDHRGTETQRYTFYSAGMSPEVEMDYEAGKLVRVVLHEQDTAEGWVYRELIFDQANDCMLEKLHRYTPIKGQP
jgi:antitoxin component YwqK of YwqJK toxin-antitoxin module